jgi:site-specific DNA-methyltransferase (adenine-specific)
MENKTYNIDCLEYMRSLDDKVFDLAIVDPPYGLHRSSTHGRGKLKDRILNADSIHEWDIVPRKEYFDQLFRVSKNQIIWGGATISTFLLRGVLSVGIRCNLGKTSHR